MTGQKPTGELTPELVGTLILRMFLWLRNAAALLFVLTIFVLIFLSESSFNASTSVSVDKGHQAPALDPSAQPSGVIIPITP
jgi:hypothetical protein